jgi:hypothetical protein
MSESHNALKAQMARSNEQVFEAPMKMWDGATGAAACSCEQWHGQSRYWKGQGLRQGGELIRLLRNATSAASHSKEYRILAM